MDDFQKELMVNQNYNDINKLVYVGPDGWPVEGFIGKPVITFIRRLIWTRKIMRYKTWRRQGGCRIKF